MDKIKASELFKSLIKNTESAFINESDVYNKEIQELFSGEYTPEQEKILKAIDFQNEFMRLSLVKAIVNTLCDYDLVESNIKDDIQLNEIALEAVKEAHDK